MRLFEVKNGEDQRSGPQTINTELNHFLMQQEEIYLTSQQCRHEYNCHQSQFKSKHQMITAEMKYGCQKSPYRGLNPGFWCRGRPCRAAAAGTGTPGVGGTTECHSFSPEMRTTCSETSTLRHGRLHCCRPHASAALNTHRHTHENSYNFTDTSEIQTLNYESVQ